MGNALNSNCFKLHYISSPMCAKMHNIYLLYHTKSWIMFQNMSYACNNNLTICKKHRLSIYTPSLLHISELTLYPTVEFKFGPK